MSFKYRSRFLRTWIPTVLGSAHGSAHTHCLWGWQVLLDWQTGSGLCAFLFSFGEWGTYLVLDFAAHPQQKYQQNEK
jgi:hypothetical protein